MKQIIFTTIFTFIFCFVTFAQTNENLCPQVKIILPNEKLIPYQIAVFTAEVGKETDEYNIEYSWEVSRGTIVKGQETSKIELVVVPEDHGENVIVTLKIKGLSKNCISDFSQTASVIPQPPNQNSEPFSRYGKVSANDEKAQLDDLYYTLLENDNYEGVMLLEFDRKTPVSKRIKRLKEIIKWLEFRKYDASRVFFSIAEADSENTTILVFQKNSEFFKDLNEKYKLLKSEDINQKINELFLKK